MRVASIMTKNVLKVRMDDSIGTMREILENIEFHHLLVVEDRKPVGILSDRDILRVISPFLDTSSEHERDLSILNKKVHQIMTRKLITVNKDTSIETASSLLLENKISCLPVISPKGEIDGIVTWKDILRFYHQKNKANS
ncbi:MAG: CBS domain-containing protein [Deltaproteobacteria bacterium]|jgi:acetoin utilization protein AcuB|nr:CBS domain-containing protein [Deltaproteobacteria bacterium]